MLYFYFEGMRILKVFARGHKCFCVGLMVIALLGVNVGVAAEIVTSSMYQAIEAGEDTLSKRPPSLRGSFLKPLEAPVTIVLPEQRSDEPISTAPCPGKALCIDGIDRWLPKNIHKAGGLLWKNTAVGRLWRLRIISSGAKAIRIQFKKFNVGEGRVWLHSAAEQIDGPYTNKGLHGDGEFWSTLIIGDAATVEYLPDPQSEPQSKVPFRLIKVQHLLEAPF